MRRILYTCLMLAVALSIASIAAGAPIQLGNLSVQWYDQQDSPCFIGYSCGPNQGIAYTTYSALNQGIDSSPMYTGAQLTSLLGFVGSNPLIAIDINQNGKVGDPDTKYLIDYVYVYFNTVLAYKFDAPGNDPTLVPQSRTGNGVSDYVIQGLDLSSLTGANTLQFEVKYGNYANVKPDHGPEINDLGDNNDGKELFFLVKAGTPQVPEPGTLLLLGSGLLGLVVTGRKKFRK